ncbi:transcription factor e2f/dimerization partner (macronuclear) [Tetrahymena thermophila SB210]|uniref:Transcription factor e2f/dimerization partner n=1 Tax=Tetrahymena thermophila (strain SB210) TaxID=312017 RepID=Q22FZ6_TETTS|nr:transcription factor e2f/dimerization partner [Tetrahymena thermophila SB210]EAR84230.2 transcription factor e2f/dimerization partner [Tetrahymena thermophila SB210]|eukprot:XP_001031893.2 transcription factor e2f/dimerization partner [Tetrahymena thermophila SB210]
MSLYQKNSDSFAVSSEQDSLDNIVVEDDYNQQDDIDSFKSFSSFDVESEEQGDEEAQVQEGEEEENENYPESNQHIQDKDSMVDDETNSEEEQQQTQEMLKRTDQIILNKINLKKRNIFQFVHRNQVSMIQDKQNGYMSKKKNQIGSNKLAQNGQQGQGTQILKREILNYSRREKSLEELSKKFLSLFLDKEESMLSLDKITNQLGVERRRIYDIINILESLKLVSRKGKNNYKWNGFQKIYETITQFDQKSLTKKEEQELTQEPQKREKSLEMLSIGFLKLFLHWKSTMTLEEAARKLSSKQIDDHKIKTKIRRLYDIANVFKSLGLIKKTSLIETKKPAFEWIGIVGLDSFAYKIMREKKSGDEEQNCEEDSLNQSQQMSQQNSFTEPKLSKKRFSNDKNSSKIDSSTGQQKQQLKKSFIIQQQLKEQREKERLLLEQNQKQQQIQQSSLNNNINNSNITQNLSQLLQTIQKNMKSQNQEAPQQNNNSSNTPLSLLSQLQILSRPIQQNLVSNLSSLINNINNNNNQNNLIQQEEQQQSSNNNLIGNLMLKCLQNVITNFVSKNTNNTQNKQQEENQTNLQQTLLESPEKVLKINNQINQNNSLSQMSSNTKMNNNSNYKCLQSSQKSTSNLGDFTTAKKQKQIINDENIPLSGEKGLHQGFSSQNTSSLKTPILKRTLTIIQPKLDECDDITPTPPTCKRSFSACLSSSNNNNINNNTQTLFQNLIQQNQNQVYPNPFSDRTNLNNNKQQIFNNLLGFQQQQQQQQQQVSSSSFKKIRKLTYENNSLQGSDNKQNDMDSKNIKKSISCENQINFNTLIQTSQQLLKNSNLQQNLNNLQQVQNNDVNQNNQLFNQLKELKINQINNIQNIRVLEHYF